MEDRNFHPVAQLAFDIEAFRRLDVFQVHAAKRRLQRCNDVAQLVGVGFIDLDIEHIDAGKFLEQHALAFHHWLRCKRSNVAQTQHRSAVRDHRHQVASRGIAECIDRICDDFFTGGSNAGRIRKRKIALIGQLLGRRNADFAGRRKLMVFKCGLT